MSRRDYLDFRLKARPKSRYKKPIKNIQKAEPVLAPLEKHVRLLRGFFFTLRKLWRIDQVVRPNPKGITS
ncbi:hypothetical protein [Pararhodobacter zhoushanensis]|uniref:Transposase n=1 Tax=Pararhodobacter zhoushanensis TaxID=2479545 RepID=A0ABT3GW83_9RHOB|nr:hypothetical protein [Pararhodobacter zhoushanensis]MCW1931818.1 hypothetical protein [Pararhodobacter zhoushanensis]